MNKLNANAVGANCVRPHFKGMTQNKGITLIALIITIIVMLVLVGVTISVALNGGIFTKAETATKETEQRAILEEMLSMMDISEEGKINAQAIRDEMSKKYTVEGSIPNITITGKLGKYNYIVSETEIKIGKSGSDDIVDSNLKKYILGADGKGRAFFGAILDEDELTFLQDPEDMSSTIHEKIKLACRNEDEEEYTYYIRYNRNVYKFEIEGIAEDESNEFYGTDKTVEGSLEKVSAAEGNLGKYVEYAGNTWIVLRDDANGVELITANTTDDEITLGGSDFDTAKDSYNAAVATLVEECKETTGLEIGGNVIGIRCIGGPAEDETEGTDTIDFSKTFEKFVPNANFPYAEFTGKNIKNGDNNYLLQDYIQMKKIGILVTDTPADYWFASRWVNERTGEVEFDVCYLLARGIWSSNTLFSVSSGGSTYCYGSDSYAVRPVVTLNPGILNNATQAGTIDDPIILN